MGRRFRVCKQRISFILQRGQRVATKDVYLSLLSERLLKSSPLVHMHSVRDSGIETLDMQRGSECGIPQLQRMILTQTSLNASLKSNILIK